MPDPFTFNDVPNVAPSTEYTSNTITVSGTALPVTITGGTYSKNGGAFTSAPGTAVVGDTFQVRQTSSAEPSTAMATILTIGGVSETYTTMTAVGVGNLINVNSWADMLTAYAAAVPGDVINMNHGGYVPTTPQQFTISRSFAAPGVTIIGNQAQVTVIRGDTQANCRTEFVNWFLSGTAYQGNTNPPVAYEYSDVDLRDCSMLAFRGCTFAQGDWGLMCRGGSGCADITVDYCLFYFLMVDCIRILNGGAANRMVVTNCYQADSTHQEKTWCVNNATDNTGPIIQSIDPGTGAIDTVPYNEHHDGIQGYGDHTGTLFDFRIQYNTIKAIGGQCIFLADGFQTRGLIADNHLYVGQAWATMVDQGQDVELSRNAYDRTPNFDPAVLCSVNFSRAGGVGNAKGGLNTFPLTKTIITDTGIDLEGPITGTATAPTAPTWSVTTSTVGNLPSLRVTRPAYTDFAGPAECARKPRIYVSGPGNAWDAGPYAAGSYLKLVHDEIKGFLYPFNSCWVRWKKDAVVKATGQYISGGSTAAMVSPATAGGSWTVEMSFDSTNGTDGIWYASDAVTVSPSTTTLDPDPSRHSARSTLSNGNLTTTQSAGADAHALAKSIGNIPQAAGMWGFELEVIPQSGSQSGAALVGPNVNTGIDPHDFIGPCVAVFGNGAFYGSNGLSGNVGGMTGSNANYGAGKKYMVVVKRTGTGGSTVLFYLQYPDGTWASSGGDPAGAGSGIDISAAFGSSAISCPGYTFKAGDIVNINFGPTYSLTKPTGMLNVPLT